ncbi:MAG: hypothetical protein EOM14_15375 [Clostridia bacterium]|nr:hypothetical protein [Clostridia bacterium]
MLFLRYISIHTPPLCFWQRRKGFVQQTDKLGARIRFIRLLRPIQRVDFYAVAAVEGVECLIVAYVLLIVGLEPLFFRRLVKCPFPYLS